MSQSEHSGDLYRVVPKEGTHLAESKDTQGAYRGTRLSDDNRQLAGQAEFIKVDESELDYDYSSQYEYQESHDVELTEEQKEMAAIFGKAAAEFVFALIDAAAPHIKNWWKEKASPSIKRTLQVHPGKKLIIKGRKERQDASSGVISTEETAPGLFTQELDEAYEKYVNDMNSDEAQRELLDIFILSAVVATKIRKLANARIRKSGNDSGTYIDGQEVIEKLSTPEYINSINRILESNPGLLEEKSAAFSEIIGRTLVIDGRYLPFEIQVLRAAFAAKAEV